MGRPFGGLAASKDVGSVELSDSVQRRLFGGLIRLPAGLVGTMGTRGKAIVFRVTSP